MIIVIINSLKFCRELNVEQELFLQNPTKEKLKAETFKTSDTVAVDVPAIRTPKLITETDPPPKDGGQWKKYHY